MNIDIKQKHRFEKVILASASPRRTELLEQIGISHIVMPSRSEEIITKSIPSDIVMELSLQKAEDVFEQCRQEFTEDFVVIGADTIVAIENRILGKPGDEKEAFAMLSLLQGKKHQVYTGVTIMKWIDGKVTRKTFSECSQVECYPMTEDEIHSYITSGEPMDKAGAYGIQGRFAAYVKAIEGDYNNIVGLPIARLYHEL